MSRKVNTPMTPATKALDAAGIQYEALPYIHDERAASYGDEAAHELNLDPHLVFKTLVLDCGGEFGVVIVPVPAKTDMKAAAAALGYKKATLADPKDVTRLTGYIIGGVSPFGMKTTLPTVIDESARRLDRLYVSGGRRGFDVGVTPDDLLRIADGRYANVRREG